MAEQRPLQTPSGTDKADDKTKLTREQRIAKIAKVLDRGYLLERLTVPLPTDRVGEWARDDPMQIAAAEALGFTVDTQHAKAHGLHGDGDGKVKVGDVVFMTIDREDYELIAEVRAKKFADAHLKPNADEAALKENIESIGLGANIQSVTKTTPLS